VGEAGNRRRKCWNTATDGAKPPFMRDLIRSVSYCEEEVIEDEPLEEVEDESLEEVEEEEESSV